MALIVENGSNIANADSYISQADAVTLAAKYGWDFPDEAGSEIPLRNAALYLEKYRNNYQGSKVYSDQSLQWPRDPVYIDDVYNEPDVIPQALINAQVAIASAIHDGANIFGTSFGNVTSRSVGDVSVTTGNNGSISNAAYMGIVNEFLKPIFKNPQNGLLEFSVCRA